MLLVLRRVSGGSAEGGLSGRIQGQIRPLRRVTGGPPVGRHSKRGNRPPVSRPNATCEPERWRITRSQTRWPCARRSLTVLCGLPPSIDACLRTPEAAEPQGGRKPVSLRTTGGKPTEEHRGYFIRLRISVTFEKGGLPPVVRRPDAALQPSDAHAPSARRGPRSEARVQVLYHGGGGGGDRRSAPFVS